MGDVFLVGIGGAGQMITDAILPLAPDAGVMRVADSHRLSPAELESADSYIVAFWKPLPRLYRELDESIRVWGKCWLPVVSEPPEVVIGPVSGPGTAACATCFDTRRRQHHRTTDISGQVHAAWERDLTLGPRGMLPSTAALAAGIAWSLLERVASGVEEAGRPPDAPYVVLNVVTLGLREGRVAAVDGCPRCRAADGYAHAPAASLAELVASFREGR